MAKDRLYIAKEDRERYTRLRDEFGEDSNWKELFMLAAGTGCRVGERQPFEKRDEFFHVRDLKDRDWALLNALALHAEDDADVTLETDEVFSIAEEYAHAGIRILADMVESSPLEGFQKHLEKRLDDVYEELME